MRAGASALCLAAIVAAFLGGAGSGRGAAQAIIVGNDAPDWSPDGASIVFTSFRHGSGEIYVINADGTAQRRLTNHRSHDDHPKWSPDGRRIAFTSTRDGDYELYVMNADGSGVRRLTNHPNADYAPTWSPDGHRIAWRTDRDGNGEIYSMAADGTDVRRLTDTTGSDQAPAWGPDGRIAFVTARQGGVFNIWVMDGDGSNVRRVTTSGTNQDRPAWSPDAKRLLFVAERDLPLGNTEIYVVSVDGGPAQRLTNDDKRDDWPAWAPDGRRIVFTRGRTIRTPEIHVANADGTNVRVLTRTASRLEIVDAYAPPPLSGRRWSILLVAQDVTERPISRGAAVCHASVGGKALRLAGTGYEGGVVRCTWDLPSSSKGKLIRGTAGLRVGNLRAQVPFVLRIR